MPVKVGGDDEIGRQLNGSEIREGQIVCVGRKGGNKMATLWVTMIEPQFIMFSAYELTPETHLLLRRVGETLRDSTGEMVVHEYLGKP